MRKIKLYEADDKMIDLITDNYSMLQGLNAFGIRLGFGDKTVDEVCSEQNVDCYTFLAVVNYIINGRRQINEYLQGPYSTIYVPHIDTSSTSNCLQYGRS